VPERILDEVRKEGTSGDETNAGREPEARSKAKGYGRNGSEANDGTADAPGLPPRSGCLPAVKELRQQHSKPILAEIRSRSED